AQQEWIVLPKRSKQPIQDAVTVFTDAGRKSRCTAATWQEGKEWRHKILQAEEGDSLQMLELAAVVWTFLNWLKAPLNVVTDSLYVARLIERIEDARIKEIQNQQLFELLR
ncbi:POK19 protein, partial [Zapornia atra]|nr:POK19 protein [Zapornia atra]